MPTETEAQWQEIYDMVCQMPSFQRHMSHPKLQNWFAWNGRSYQQQPEFFGARLAFEPQLGDEAGPIPDEVFALRPSTDPRAELQRILKAGGGIKLALRIMRDGLQQHSKVQYIAEKVSGLDKCS